MTIKIAQISPTGSELVSREEADGMLADTHFLDVEIEIDPENEHEEELLEHHPEIEGHIHISSDDEDFKFDAKKEFSFTLGKFPGSDSEEEIEEPSELSVSEEDDKVQVTDDPWKWTHDKFLPWLENKLKTVPRHNGKDISGIEKAIAYLKYLEGECSKASRTDIHDLVDTSLLEKARQEIYDGLDRLFDRLEKLESIKNPMKRKKKKASDDSVGFVKEAKSIHFEVNVPYFISLLARICINSSVSAGHDIEEVFMDLCKKYDLTKQQKLEVVHLIEDMGYASVWRDRSKMIGEEIDLTSAENGDWAAQYPA
jgi:hypothetical protein